MGFFTFRQNNSGGSFDHEAEKGIGICVFVEAANADEAIARAEGIGLYFNGCEAGRDCGCCGDRWSSYFGRGDNTEAPMLYGGKWRPVAEGEEPALDWGIPSYIHYAAGNFVTATKDET